MRLEYTIIQKKYKKATTTRSGAPAPPEPGDAGQNDDEVPLAYQFHYDSTRYTSNKHFDDIDQNNHIIGSNGMMMNRRPSINKGSSQQQPYQRKAGESPSNLGQATTLKRHGSVTKLQPSASTSNLMQIQQDEIAQLKAQLDEQKRVGNQLNEEKEKAIRNVDQYKSLYMVRLQFHSRPAIRF